MSGGQRQRIAIARALVSKPRILVLDDSFSAVDAETDAQIQRALREHIEGMTTFVVSHRVSTVSEADLILVLEGGELTQSGTHEALRSQPGLYRRICAIQDLLEEDIREATA